MIEKMIAIMVLIKEANEHLADRENFKVNNPERSTMFCGTPKAWVVNNLKLARRMLLEIIKEVESDP